MVFHIFFYFAAFISAIYNIFLIFKVDRREKELTAENDTLKQKIEQLIKENQQLRKEEG